MNALVLRLKAGNGAKAPTEESSMDARMHANANAEGLIVVMEGSFVAQIVITQKMKILCRRTGRRWGRK